MTRDEQRRAFIARHQHEIGGIVFDAITARGRHDKELSLWTMSVMETIRKRLGAAFDELLPAPVVTPKPEAEPTRNGQHTPQPKQPQPVRQS